VKDRRYDSNGEVIEEWERPRTIADDFYYDQETNCYYAPGEPYYWKEEKTPAMLQEIEEYWRLYDEREAAKLRDAPPRKLPAEKPKRRDQRSLFADLTDDDEAAE
jgi:hypothetical protein